MTRETAVDLYNDELYLEVAKVLGWTGFSEMTHPETDEHVCYGGLPPGQNIGSMAKIPNFVKDIDAAIELLPKDQSVHMEYNSKKKVWRVRIEGCGYSEAKLMGRAICLNWLAWKKMWNYAR